LAIAYRLITLIRSDRIRTVRRCSNFWLGVLSMIRLMFGEDSDRPVIFEMGRVFFR
jgi:hypothetical protein